jgi:hypothetical protein
VVGVNAATRRSVSTSRPIIGNASSRVQRKSMNDRIEDFARVLQGVEVGPSGQWQFKHAPRLCLQGKGKLGGLSIHLRAVDDIRRTVNPRIVHGQTHCGIGQGVGQALLERSHYDLETGQLLAASFMDYAMPRRHLSSANDRAQRGAVALEPPRRALRWRRRHHAGARAAVINAIVDALSELGVRHIEMPATPERVWRAIRVSRSGTTD